MNKSAYNFGKLAGQAAYMNKRAGEPFDGSAGMRGPFPIKSQGIVPFAKGWYNAVKPQQYVNPSSGKSNAITDPSKGPGVAKLSPPPITGDNPIGYAKGTNNAMQWPDYMRMIGMPADSTKRSIQPFLEKYPALATNVENAASANEELGRHPGQGRGAPYSYSFPKGNQAAVYKYKTEGLGQSKGPEGIAYNPRIHGAISAMPPRNE